MIAADSMMVRPSSSSSTGTRAKRLLARNAGFAGRALGKIERHPLERDAELGQQDTDLPGIAGQPAVIETKHDGDPAFSQR